METGKPTRVQPGHGGALVSVPGIAPAETEAYERSPTLMAGEVAGMQGQVRIWSPSRRLLQEVAIGFGLGSLLLLLVMIVISGSWSFFASTLLSLLTGFCASIVGLLRPCYVTTDSAGIGITTLWGSQALRWSDIRMAERVCYLGMCRYPKITLRAPHTVVINLTGYPEELQDELFAHITTRSALQQHPVQKRLFINPDLPLPLPAGLMGEGSEDIRSEVIVGRKREAIRRYRKRNGSSLKDAKAAVEALEVSIQVKSP